MSDANARVALGAVHHERTEKRRGYRHGSEERTLTTGSGKTTFNMPRAKIFAAGGVELPFGGVGRSGHGREKGMAALHTFSTLKTVIAHHG